MAALSTNDSLFISHKHGACADSFHDFSHGKSFNTKRDEDANKPGLYEVLKGLPVSSNKSINDIPTSREGARIDGDMLRSEATMLNELFTGIPINGVVVSDPLGQESGNIIKKIIDAMRKGASGSVSSKGEVVPGADSYANVDLKFNNLDGLATGYTLKILHNTLDNGTISGNVKEIQCRLTSDDYVNFFGSNQINLLFDAAVINVTNIIRKCKPGAAGGAPIYLKRVINRELINDPAPKTYYEPPPTGEIANNVNFEIAFETNIEDITYSKTTGNLTKTNDYQRDKFFSKFDFRLSPMNRETDKKGDKRLPKTTVDIIGDDGKRIYNNDNPHENNNIAKCWARIIQAFKTSKIKHIEASAYFQCKRSGDWLQALSCLDTGRKYIGTSPSATPAVLPGNKIILVTHDRVLLWYALFLGIDVLMTYKVAKPGAKEVDEEDVEEELETDIKCQPGSERYMLYFSANSRSEDDEERDIRLYETMEALLGQDKDLSVVANWIKNYNLWLSQIKTENVTIIDSIWADIAASPPTSRGFAGKMSALLQAYFQYTALDYTEISTTKLATLITKFNTAADEGANEEGDVVVTPEISAAANSLLSYYNNMLYKSLSLSSKEKLINANTAYKYDDLYVNPVSLGTILGAISRERVTKDGVKTLSPSARAVATAGFFSSRLPEDLLEKLCDQMTQLKEKLTAVCVLDVFLPNLITGLDTKKQTELQIVEQLKMASVEGKALKTGVKTVVEEIDNVVDEETITEREAVLAAGPAVRDTAQIASEDIALPESGGKGIGGPKAVRQEIISMATIGDAIRRFGHYIRGMVLRGSAGYGVQGGGALPDVVVSKLLYKLYLRQLYLDLSAFETDENQDYIYYDALTRMVLSCSTRNELRAPNYYGRMEHLFYDVLPNGGWVEAEESAGAKFMKNEKFAHMVAHIAKNVALHSIDLAEGSITPLGNAGSIAAGVVAVYNDLKVKLNDISFKSRQDFLLNEIRARMLTYIPAGEGIVTAGLASISMRTGVGSAPIAPVGLPSFTPAARQAVSAPAGGRRTRRRRHKSNRKSRKTRR